MPVLFFFRRFLVIPEGAMRGRYQRKISGKDIRGSHERKISEKDIRGSHEREI